MDDKVNTGHNIEDKELIKNARKPVGELGHQILDRMNKSHENMAQWGVSHFEIKEDSKILISVVAAEETLKDLPYRYPKTEGLLESTILKSALKSQ